MKSVEEYFYLYYDLKDEMIRLSKDGNDIRKAFITKIYCVPKNEVKSNYNDVKKSGINSKRDKDRHILLQEILTKIEGRAKMGERSIVIEEPVNSWDFILPVVEKLRELGFTVDPKFLQARGWVLAIYWNRKPKSGAENLIIAALAILVLIWLIWLIWL